MRTELINMCTRYWPDVEQTNNTDGKHSAAVTRLQVLDTPRKYVELNAFAKRTLIDPTHECIVCMQSDHMHTTGPSTVKYRTT